MDFSRLKVFETFEYVSKCFQSNDTIIINYWCVYKKISKTAMKEIRLKNIDNARKEYKYLIERRFSYV